MNAKNIRLQKLKGNIVDIEADFLVNASNTTLKLGSGVSMVLKKACGPNLQKSMDEIYEEMLQSNNLINQGDVFATPAFNLVKAKFVLHAAVINYNPGVKQFESKPSLNTVSQILSNTIPYIEWFNNKYNSRPKIAFPYIGCGVGGLNKKEVEAIFEKFIKENESLNADLFLVEYF